VLADRLPERGAEVARPAPGMPWRGWLLFSGLLLICLFVAGAVFERLDGNETTKTSHGHEYQTTVTTGYEEVTKRSDGKEVTKSSKIDQKASAKKASKGGAKKASEGGAQEEPKYSREVSISKSFPPEGVLLALLGTGVALILCGGLYSRLTTIKLLGGEVELDLSNEVTKAESKKLQQAVVNKAEGKDSGGPDPTKVAEAAIVAYAVARAHKRTTGRKLTPEIIGLAADIGVKAAGFE
jgi:hypothetical protein